MNEHISKELNPLIENISKGFSQRLKFIQASDELTDILYKSAKYNGYRGILKMLSTKMKKVDEVPISDEGTMISSLLSLRNTIDQALIILNTIDGEAKSLHTIGLGLKLAKAEYGKIIPVMTIEER